MSVVKLVDVKILNQWLEDDNAIIIDVREAVEFNIERILGAKNIPLAQICLADVQLPEYQNKKIVIQCRSGKRSDSACRKLIEYDSSLELWNLEGGILDWVKCGYKVIHLPVT